MNVSPNKINDISITYISENVQKRVCISSKNLYQFLQNIQFKYGTQKYDKNTNIIDQGEKKTYNLPVYMRQQLYTLLEQCRLNNAITHLSERQIEPCGFMLDFDLLTCNKSIFFHNDDILMLTNALCRELYKDIKFNENTQYVFYTCKPYVEQKDENVYKYGIHILIPGLLLHKAYKKLFLNKFKNNNTLISILTKNNIINIDQCLDQNSASVPVLLFGSCKLGSSPYILSHAFKIYVEQEYQSLMISPVSLESLADYNLTAELSILSDAIYENKIPLVKKQTYVYTQEIDNVIQNQPCSSNDTENILIDNDLTILTIHDPDARILYSLLDILSEEYYTDRNKWRNIIYALSNKSNTYKPLAIWFSQKCIEKWNNNGMNELNELWDNAQKNIENPLTISSIFFWAKLSDIEQYNKIMKKSYFNILLEYVYDNMGKLENFHFAKILFLMLCDKFITDFDINSTSKKLIWYEFVLPNEKMKFGEVWKWRKEIEPIVLQLHISENITKICDLIIDHINEQLESTYVDTRITYYKNLSKTFLSTKSRLFNHKFKIDTIQQASFLFHKRGFSESLDTIPELFGVGNGILKLGKKCELINYFHEYPVNKYTTVEWIPFNEKNPMTLLVLNAIADIIVEHDVRNWILFHAAQGLSRDVKEGLLLLFEGGGQNGKTSLLRWIAKVLGPYADKFNIQLLSSEREDADKPNSAMMKFKYINWAYAEESNKAQVLNVARMKEIVNAGEISTRDLNSKQETFTMRCNFVVASQYSFIVNTNDHGTWRRIKYYSSKVKFCENPDVNNIYEKKENQDFNLKYSSDPDFLSSLLSILVHYYERLQNEYNGLLKNVPCLTLDIETESFRMNQDTIHRWICECIVISPLVENEYDMGIITAHYIEWYKLNIDRKFTTTVTTFYKDIRSSIINKYLKHLPNNKAILKNCRLLNTNENILYEGESYMSLKASKIDSYKQLTDKIDWWN